MSAHLQQKIKTFLDQSGETVASLERKAGLKPNTMRNILRGKSNRPSANTLNALANAMDCGVKDLLDSVTVLTASTSSPLVKPPVVSSDLSVEHPAVLIDILKRILELQNSIKKPLPLKQLLFLLEESYSYGIKKSPPQADPDFIKWIFERVGSV